MDSSTRRRLRISRILYAATFVLTLISGPILYVSSVIDDEDAFVSVADQIVARPEVRTVIAESVTTITFEALAADEALADVLPDQAKTFAVPLTRIATSQLTDAAFRLLDTEIAVEVRDTALREVHRQITADTDEVTIDLRAVLVRTSREIGGPTIGAGVAKFVSGRDTGRYTLAPAGSSTAKLVAAVRLVPTLGALVAFAALAFLVLGILVAPDRRRGLIVGGLTLAASAAVSTLAIWVVLFAVLGASGAESGIGVAVAEIVASDFAQQERGIIVNGAVLALIGLLLGERPSAVAIRSLPGHLWSRRPGLSQSIANIIGDNPPLARAGVWFTGLFAISLWSSPTKRILLTILALSIASQIGIWLATNPGEAANRWRKQVGFSISPPRRAEDNSSRIRINLGVITAVLILLWPAWSTSVVTVIVALGALAQALVDLPAARRMARQTKPTTTEQVATPKRQRRYLVAGTAVGAFAILGVLSTSGATERTAASSDCNGLAQLCDRRIDEVVFAGSHNSMSSTELGWELAMQTGDIVAQLDDGIRALLIDALYWKKQGSLDGGDEAAAASIIEAALSEDEPMPGAWLCHGFCALGATDLTGGLADIALWLETNPREVLLIIVQDEISESDLMEAFEASGLRRYAYTHEPGSPFPTLGAMIEADQRILVYGENGGSPTSWFQNAWDTAFTETPYTFSLRSEFSCAPNRGVETNPLFLINHWLTTGIPVKEAAATINSREALLKRVEDCRSERGRLPTVLATDFSQTGDLVAVVDELNGLAN